MSPEIATLTGLLCIAIAAAGVFGGLWWGERNKGKTLERVYDHMRDRVLAMTPGEDSRNGPLRTHVPAIRGG